MIKKSPRGAKDGADGIVLSPEARGTTMMGPETPPPPATQSAAVVRHLLPQQPSRPSAMATAKPQPKAPGKLVFVAKGTF